MLGCRIFIVETLMAYLLSLLGELNKRNGLAHSVECKCQVGSWICKSVAQTRGVSWRYKCRSLQHADAYMPKYINQTVNLVIGSVIDTIHQFINLQQRIHFSYTWKVPSPYLGKLPTDPSIKYRKIRLVIKNCFNTESEQKGDKRFERCFQSMKV